jgi:hypothetical protein
LKAGDEDQLAFRTWYGLFEPAVMQFGTTNAPADFQGYINNAIGEALHDFATAYLDDVLIYRNAKEEHVGNLKWIIQCLLDAGLYLNAEICMFHTETVRYFWLIISTKGISMDEDMVDRVQN